MKIIDSISATQFHLLVQQLKKKKGGGGGEHICVLGLFEGSLFIPR